MSKGWGKNHFTFFLFAIQLFPVTLSKGLKKSLIMNSPSVDAMRKIEACVLSSKVFVVAFINLEAKQAVYIMILQLP